MMLCHCSLSTDTDSRERSLKMDQFLTIKPDCSAIPLSIRCNVLYTNGWCQWDDAASKCTDNFNDALFISSVDPIISKSLIFILCAVALVLMFKVSQFIITKMSVSRGLGKEMVLKCSVYAVEACAGSICLILFIHYGGAHVLLTEFMDSSPDGLADLARCFCIAQIWVLLYALELLIIPEMRSMLQLHHIGTIVGYVAVH